MTDRVIQQKWFVDGAEFGQEINRAHVIAGNIANSQESQFLFFPLLLKLVLLNLFAVLVFPVNAIDEEG